MATVTIVDEISRAAEILLDDVINNSQKAKNWNNNKNLVEALKIIANNATTPKIL
jgi:phosphopantothenate synthetase